MSKQNKLYIHRVSGIYEPVVISGNNGKRLKIGCMSCEFEEASYIVDKLIRLKAEQEKGIVIRYKGDDGEAKIVRTKELKAVKKWLETELVIEGIVTQENHVYNEGSI